MDAPLPERAAATRLDFPIEATAFARIVPPAEGAADQPAPCFVWVHGYAQPQQAFERYAREVTPPSAWILLPEAPSTFHARRGLPPEERGVARAWIGTLDREPEDQRNSALIHRAIDLLEARASIDPARILIGGFSQGAGVASRAILDRPDRFAGLAGLAGGITAPWRDRLTALANKPVLWITGTEDSSYPPAYIDPLLADFAKSGVAVEHHALAAGHQLLERAKPQFAAWLATQLVRTP